MSAVSRVYSSRERSRYAVHSVWRFAAYFAIRAGVSSGTLSYVGR